MCIPCAYTFVYHVTLDSGHRTLRWCAKTEYFAVGINSYDKCRKGQSAWCAAHIMSPNVAVVITVLWIKITTQWKRRHCDFASPQVAEYTGLFGRCGHSHLRIVRFPNLAAPRDSDKNRFGATSFRFPAAKINFFWLFIPAKYAIFPYNSENK